MVEAWFHFFQATKRRSHAKPRQPVARSPRLSGLVAEDVGVTGIQDGHGAATEELSAGSAELDLDLGGIKVSLMNRYPPKSVARLLLWADPKTAGTPSANNRLQAGSNQSSGKDEEQSLPLLLQQSRGGIGAVLTLVPL